jgi:tRNA (mo5U34)-methyltransferase
MEALGAAHVLACDWFCWDKGPGPGTKHLFNKLHKKFNSKVETLEIDIPDMTEDTIEKFDVVLALGLFYHLPSFLTSFVNLAKLSKQTILIESAIDTKIPQDYACLRLYMFDDYCRDATNWFIPNAQTYRDVLKYCGFTTVRENFYKIGDFDRGVFCGER